ncbi:MAG: hypothetical protein A2785_02085 [Candidatus Chisholmbacteria bacterium RIFCSPHIGHO2_01_FULL_49_18]|uniref:Uncharacterized protein n=2 Tax=Candidatus Chisholmiibacteriota TaxID=1817900 RepID=A0A1G1VM41_9BACT|nr:MAG: hypothetical protein A2785_02085 [Candidatus Chisholmbacteria bacterium RIFCSPHIGHO2_01_FULL_49_18]OGY22611.1 MAG: hypothetical protein A3A65_05900 [Candidatus Chisholmbacteria bacterium RIFCSPLOWO2_01_FULL_49_14]
MMEESIQPQGPNDPPDRELQDLWSQSSEVLGEQSLSRVVQALQRFNTRFIVIEKDGSEREEENLIVKEALREIPGYADSAYRVGLAPEQAEELLIHLLDSNPYDFEQNDVSILLLKRSLDQEAELHQRLTTNDISRLKGMITLAGKYGVLPSSLYSYTTLRRIGLSKEDSTALVMYLPDTDGHLAGYSFGPFEEALSSLAIAPIVPKIVKEIFECVGGARPYYRQHVYRALEELIIFASPSNRTTPQELLQGLLTNGEGGGDIADAIDKYLSEDQTNLLGENGMVIYKVGEEREKYFIPRSGRLEHAALPYRIQRGLDAGVQDLEELVRARSHRWEAVGEGMWIFDPKTKTWYSLGGKTEIHPGKVTHNFIHFDASKLTERPYMFHLHPEDLEIMLRNPFDDFPSREYRDHVTKFLSSTPSGADYSVVADTLERATSEIHPRSFIVHALGITEFTYPHDLDKIRKMSILSRDVRDQALLNFDWNEFLWRREIADEAKVTRMLVDDLNKVLPEGFAITLYEHGTNLEEAI